MRRTLREEWTSCSSSRVCITQTAAVANAHPQPDFLREGLSQDKSDARLIRYQPVPPQGFPVEEDEEDVDSELEGRGSARSCLYALLTTS